MTVNKDGKQDSLPSPRSPQKSDAKISQWPPSGSFCLGQAFSCFDKPVTWSKLKSPSTWHKIYFPFDVVNLPHQLDQETLANIPSGALG